MARVLDSGEVRILDRVFRLRGYSDDPWYQDLRRRGVFAEVNVVALAEMIPPDAVCLDLGAHLGLVSLALAAIATQGHVYAFEGSPDTTHALRATIADNRLGNVDVFNTVIGKADEPVKFFDIPEVRSSAFSVPMESERQVSILQPETSQMMVLRAKSVDQIVRELGLSRVDLIKIDIEGAELDALHGAGATLAKFKPIVVLEFNSFAYAHTREIVPRHALMTVFSFFDEVYYFKNRNGGLVRLENTEAAREKFLAHNILHGFVDDLVCCRSGARLLDGRALRDASPMRVPAETLPESAPPVEPPTAGEQPPPAIALPPAGDHRAQTLAEACGRELLHELGIRIARRFGRVSRT